MGLHDSESCACRLNFQNCRFAAKEQHPESFGGYFSLKTILYFREVLFKDPRDASFLLTAEVFLLTVRLFYLRSGNRK